MAVKMEKLGMLAILLCALGVTNAAAQEQTSTPKPKSELEVVRPPRARPLPGTPTHPTFARQTSERSITVDPNVNIKMCVAKGSLKINGWERNEVRVFVRSGRLPGFRVLEKNSESGKANWLQVLHVRAEGTPPGFRP